MVFFGLFYFCSVTSAILSHPFLSCFGFQGGELVVESCRSDYNWAKWSPSWGVFKISPQCLLIASSLSQATVSCPAGTLNSPHLPTPDPAFTDYCSLKSQMNIFSKLHLKVHSLVSIPF